MKKTVSVFVVVFMLGCASTGIQHDRVPPKETEQVNMPVSSCEPPIDLPELILPEWPEQPVPGASVQEMKTYYADIAEVAKARFKMLMERIRTLGKQLDQYRPGG